MVVKRNFDKNKILIGWWMGIDKINSADGIGRGKLLRRRCGRE